MKTTLDLPEDILKEAMHFAGKQTQQEIVVKALTQFNRKHKLDTLLARLGRSNTFMTSKELLELRAQESA